MKPSDKMNYKRRRLAGFDYSSCGAYFVTICVKDRTALFRNVAPDNIRYTKMPSLSRYGEIVDAAIEGISSHYENVVVDKYCIMPDHIHMIILILSDEYGRMISAATLSTIVGSMKRWVSKQIGFSIWQRSFNDRIIQNQRSYEEVWRYIDENLLKWEIGEHY